MNSCLLSVIVPVYNVERYLPQALDSLLSQTVEPGTLEVICVDDASTDSSRNILHTYAERAREGAGHTLHVLEQPRNRGYGSAMNVGIAAARGAFIGNLDPDDYAEPGMYQALLEAAFKHDADLVKSNFYAHAENRERDLFVETLRGHVYDTPLNVDSDRTIALLQPCVWSAIYRRDLIGAQGIRFNETSGASYQDISFAFKALCSARRVVLVRDAYVHYRIDNAASSIHSTGKAHAVFAEMDAIEAFVTADATRYEKLGPLMVYREFWLHQWNLARMGAGVSADEANRLMAGRLRRAQAEGLIDLSLFSNKETADLIRLLHYDGLPQALR